MKNISIIVLTLTTLVLFTTACEPNDQKSDAYGNFEAKEVIVAAEANGRLIAFGVEEGQQLTKNQVIGYIDTTQLTLKKQQMKASIKAILSKRQNVDTQSKVYEKQKSNLKREIARLEKLLADGAATPKQLDDIKGQLELVERQEDAHITSLITANRGIASEVQPLLTQISQIDDQIQKSIIKNPIDGKVLTKFVEENEVTGFARPLYKIADTKDMYLRIYVEGHLLDDIQIGQQVKVLVDDDADAYHELEGTLTWIAEEAEFTPRSIQTKDDRAKLVYAAKVKVNNDGKLKIGMPGEVNF
jgi:HlyD family secretion protein